MAPPGAKRHFLSSIISFWPSAASPGCLSCLVDVTAKDDHIVDMYILGVDVFQHNVALSVKLKLALRWAMIEWVHLPRPPDSNPS